MYGYVILHIKLDERAVVFDRGRPLRALEPGRHRVWGHKLTEQRWNTRERLVFDALPEVRAVLPSAWYREVTLENEQRGVLYRDAQPVEYLTSGTHRYWCVDPSVELRTFATDAPMPPLTHALLKVIPSGEYTRRTLEAHEQGMLMVSGKLVRALGPGSYALWSTPEAPVRIVAQDMRVQQATLAPQELMTRDKVTLRLTLSAEYVVVDPARVITSTVSAHDSVYLHAQLAARGYIAGVTLDQLLEGRDALTQHLEQEVGPYALKLGLRVERIGLKDIVLPGEMKLLLNKVIEAEKAAAANVITRREEAAATRLLANTAKLLAEQPLLMRLRELETLKDVAQQIDEVRVLVGADGLDKLLTPSLFTS